MPLRIIFPATFVVAQLCLFGPHTIYAGNLAEFSAPFSTLVRPLIVVGVVVVLALTAICRRLSTKSSAYSIALLFGVGLALWIQGNLLVADYGLLDGSDIDWTLECRGGIRTSSGCGVSCHCCRSHSHGQSRRSLPSPARYS